MKKEREREKKKNKLIYANRITTLLSKEFLLFFTMPIPIEMVMPVRTTRAVHLMISFAIHTFKDMRT